MSEENVLLKMAYDKDEMEKYVNDKLRSVAEGGQYYICKDYIECRRKDSQTDRREFKIYLRIYWACNARLGVMYEGVSIEICDLEDYI